MTPTVGLVATTRRRILAMGSPTPMRIGTVRLVAPMASTPAAIGLQGRLLAATRDAALARGSTALTARRALATTTRATLAAGLRLAATRRRGLGPVAAMTTTVGRQLLRAATPTLGAHSLTALAADSLRLTATTARSCRFRGGLAASLAAATALLGGAGGALATTFCHGRGSCFLSAIRHVHAGPKLAGTRFPTVGRGANAHALATRDLTAPRLAGALGLLDVAARALALRRRGRAVRSEPLRVISAGKASVALARGRAEFLGERARQRLLLPSRRHARLERLLLSRGQVPARDALTSILLQLAHHRASRAVSAVCATTVDGSDRRNARIRMHPARFRVAVAFRLVFRDLEAATRDSAHTEAFPAGRSVSRVAGPRGDAVRAA